MKLRDTRAGFTIIEVVLAMGILLIGVTAVIGLLTFGASMMHGAHMRSAAANVVEAVTADLEETLFPLEEDGSVGDPQDFEARALPGFEGVTYSVTSFQNPVTPIEYRVDVEILWESGGVLRSHEFSTILLRQVPFGERMRSEFVEGKPRKRRTPVAETEE